MRVHLLPVPHRFLAALPVVGHPTLDTAVEFLDTGQQRLPPGCAESSPSTGFPLAPPSYARDGSSTAPLCSGKTGTQGSELPAVAWPTRPALRGFTFVQDSVSSSGFLPTRPRGSCSCLRLVVAFGRPHKGLSPSSEALPQTGEACWVFPALRVLPKSRPGASLERPASQASGAWTW